IGRRQDVAAEDKALRREFVANRIRTDTGTVIAYQAAAAKAERQDVWHAEIGPHAADIDRYRRFARKTMQRHAYVRRGATDIHDHRFFGLREERCAAHGVGGSRCEGQNWIFLDMLGVHQSAVILTDVEWCMDVEPAQRLAKRLDNEARQLL